MISNELRYAAWLCETSKRPPSEFETLLNIEPRDDLHTGIKALADQLAAVTKERDEAVERIAEMERGIDIIRTQAARYGTERDEERKVNDAVSAHARTSEAERDEAVRLLRYSTIIGGTCEHLDGGEHEDSYPLDDPDTHVCSDVDEHQQTKCWTHQLFAFLARIDGGTT